jgi:hypothetical protein
MRSSPLLVLAVGACSPDYYVTKGPDDAPPDPVDSDVAAPLDTEPPDTDPPPETDLPPVDETDPPPVDESDLPPEDTGEPPLPAAYPVYAHTRDTLYRVEPATGVATSIGKFSLPGGSSPEIVDIAIDLQGRLYGGSNRTGSATSRTVYRIDPTTAVLTRVCETPADVDLAAMTFTSDGRLLAGSVGSLIEIDLARSCRTTTLFQSTGWVTAGDVVGLPGGLVYWTLKGSTFQNNRLAVVDLNPPSGPTGRLVGTVDVERVYGLAYDEALDTLYGFSAQEGQIVRLDPRTGLAVLVDKDAALSWWGATANPVLWTP